MQDKMNKTLTSFSNRITSSPMALSSNFKFDQYYSSTRQLQLNTTLKHIQNSGVIAHLRANSPLVPIEAARAAINGGISVLEIVMSTPGVFEDHPTMALGVGTVLSVEDAKNATDAGAKFLMSPATVKDIMEDVRGGEALYIPGVVTPTEILSAHDAGAKIVKHISALKKPFYHIQMVASQGITIDSIGDYIAQGATSVVLSNAIFNKETLGQNNFDKIYQLASLAALQGANIAGCFILGLFLGYYSL